MIKKSQRKCSPQNEGSLGHINFYQVRGSVIVVSNLYLYTIDWMTVGNAHSKLSSGLHVTNGCRQRPDEVIKWSFVVVWALLSTFRNVLRAGGFS